MRYVSNIFSVKRILKAVGRSVMIYECCCCYHELPFFSKLSAVEISVGGGTAKSCSS
ncbi:hypothetical protein Hdeb2414_s0006g00196121 [Helianthus debilis subsp. tardiflorus]